MKEYAQQFQMHIAEDRSHVILEFRVKGKQVSIVLKPDQAVGIARKILQDLRRIAAMPAPAGTDALAKRRAICGPFYFLLPIKRERYASRCAALSREFGEQRSQHRWQYDWKLPA